MRALTTVPLQAGTLAVVDVPDPVPHEGDLLVDAIAVGVCGTDKEIAQGEYGWAPPGHERLVLGHESLGRVREAPAGSGFAAGDLVVGVVRRPDPVPCGACAHGEFDMCRNGRYTERGIKQIDGYASEQWTVEADYAVKLDARLADVGMLMEPTTVVAKAWEQVERIGARAWFEPETVLITGAGPIGLLAALLGTQRGLDVHVLDQVRSGPKPQLVHGIGLEAPTGGATLKDRAARIAKGGLDAAGWVRSPYTIDGKQRLFAEPPHMQASMLFLSQGATVPQVGDEVDVRVRFTATTFDETVISE